MIDIPHFEWDDRTADVQFAVRVQERSIVASISITVG